MYNTKQKILLIINIAIILTIGINYTLIMANDYAMTTASSYYAFGEITTDYMQNAIIYTMYHSLLWELIIYACSQLLLFILFIFKKDKLLIIVLVTLFLFTVYCVYYEAIYTVSSKFMASVPLVCGLIYLLINKLDNTKDKKK